MKTISALDPPQSKMIYNKTKLNSASFLEEVFIITVYYVEIRNCTFNSPEDTVRKEYKTIAMKS